MEKKESQRFSIRKFNFGVASVLLGTAIFVMGATSVQADEVSATTEVQSSFTAKLNENQVNSVQESNVEQNNVSRVESNEGQQNNATVAPTNTNDNAKVEVNDIHQNTPVAKNEEGVQESNVEQNNVSRVESNEGQQNNATVAPTNTNDNAKVEVNDIHQNTPVAKNEEGVQESNVEQNNVSRVESNEGQQNNATVAPTNTNDNAKVEVNDIHQNTPVAKNEEGVQIKELNSVTSEPVTTNSSQVIEEEKVDNHPSNERRRAKREATSPTEESKTTFSKTGDTITVQNPDVEVNFPNGNGLFTPVETVIRMNMPDSLTIKRNDKLVVDIPDAVRIPTSLHYDVTGPDGQVIGNAFLDSINNKVITTFTDYFEKNNIDKKYTLNISTGWKASVKPNVPIELNFSGTKITVTVGPENAPTPASKSKVEKYGEAVTGHPELIRWTIRVNAGSLVAPQVLNNYQLIDSLPDDQELVQDGDPVLKEFDDQRKAAWRAGHADDIPSDHVDLWNGKALRAEKVQSISPWVSKGNAIQLLENIKTSSSGFSFKIAQLNEMIYVRYMTRLKNVSAHPTLAELQQKHGNDIKITYNNGEEYSYQATFAFKAGGSGSATKAKKPARVDLSFTKKLEGRNLKRNEFTFNLIDDSTGKVVDTQKNDSLGNITFDPLLFNSAGTYHYTVEEVTGSETGMTYDPMKANVTITVNANGDSYVAQTTMPTDTEFNNTFKSSPVKVNLEFNKELSNGTLNAGDFSFTLTANTAGDTNTDQRVTNAANGKINFSELSFDKEGVYNYTVKEEKGNKPDVDYDEMTVAVKVTVTKDEDSGLLTAKTEMTATGGEATGADDKTFNNHVVAPVTAQFDFSKALAGRTLKAGEFSFVLKDKNGTVLQTKTNDASGKVAFDALTYKNNEVGEHKYTVEEVAGSEAGMTYDPMKAEVTVTVTKAGHTLTATKALPTDTEFNNTFTPAATSAQFSFTKKLEGKTLEADAFTFELLENGHVIQTKKNKADGTIQFDAISYAAEGTHTYTVREVAGTDTNIDYDSMNATVTVNVTKDAQTGLLNAAVTMPADSEFNNYAVAPVTAQFDFSKALAGRTLKDGEFSFVLKDANGTVLQTKTNDANGKVAFDALTYKNNEVGVHKYTVEEVAGSEAGMAYDPMKAEVTVTVTKAGHTLTATKVLPTDTEFNNTFTPAATSAQFNFTKKLEGKTLEANAFTFELLENGTVIQTKKNDANGNIQFDAISYAAEGTHTYTVREVAGTDTDIDYDSMNAEVTVNVTKNATTGALTANVTMPTDSEFNNYAVAPVTAQFDFSKALAGRTLKDGEFSFVLKDANGTVLQTKTNDANGKVAFDALTYKNNEVGVHKYTVEEVAGSEAGMAYDPMKAEVTVTVTKAGHTLTATKALPTDTEFNNTFTPAATSAQFKFTKKLEGKALEADAFTFELLENGQVLQTKKNAADGTIQFDAISYDKEGTHTYTVREVAGTDTDIDYDTMNAEVTVKVTKDATTGILTANVVMPEDSEFNNYAVAPVTAQFDFSKVLAGRTLKAGEFSFVLKDATGKVLQTKTNDASGKVAFDALTYKNNEVGIHKYTVEEVKGTETGIEYDPMKAEVTVTVTKAGHTLTATKALPTDTEFNNTFTPAATSAQFKFTKKLEGKALEADAFTFELLENGQVLQTKKNAADGTIQFDAISYDKEGSHTYTVREVAGTDTDIDYDTMNAEVTVKVTKDATTGILTANVVMPEDSEFNNYAVAPVTAQFDFSKVLAGRTLKAGEFSFVLKDATGKVLQTKTNDASGKVAFDALTYKNNEVGIHKYTVEEVKGTETGIEYDPMKAEVTVTVTKAGHTLTATKALPTDTEFNNTFTPAATSAQFKFTKKLEGKALEADAFTFELLENGQVLQTKKNAADGTIQFDAISYDKEGTHTYTVREVAGTDTDIDYDTMNAEVTVKVTKDATTGILTANVVMPEDSEFNNYAVAPVTAQFDFSKVLAGRTLKAGEFSFVLKDATGKVLQTKTNDASGKVAFDALTYKNNEVGIHKYTVEEVKGTETGIEYDPMKAEVTVTVTKAGHTLTATKALPTDTEFNNTFTPAATSAQFKFTKKLEGKALEADAFTFELLENGQVLQTKKNAADGTIQFDAISYDKEGTHTYTVREVAGTDTDIDYDTMNAEVTVKVTKDATTGILTANVVMPEDSEFNNYAVAPVTAQFDFSKVLAGRTLKAGEFSFVLKDATGKVLQTKTNDASGKVAFDALTYKNNEVGIHKYTVEEVKGTETGIEYDPMKAEVTVTVTKAGHTLTATKALPTDTEFNNTFTPAATSAQFKFTKKLEGKALEADAFTFELLENGQVLQTKKNAADGTIQFDAISYDKEGTHTYTVREVAGTDTDIDYDTMNAEVTVKVTKDATTGILTANVVMPEDSEFNNYAVAPVTAQFDFSKVLAGRTLKAGEFSFVLKDATGKVLQTKTNDASGKVAFDALTYKNNEVGIHKYTVEEVKGTETGIEYDPMKAEVTVTVTKAGHTLTATKALPTDTEFNNTFTPAATSAQFKFTKKLEGKALEADAFTFELLENGQVLQTKKNAADGTIQFDAISYDKEGTHTYTVREVAGTDTDIDYDTMNAEVTVKVTKDATTGILTANVVMPEDSEFNNYAVAPVTAQFDFSKVLAGRTLKAGEFSFVLKDATGKVLQTKTNDASGKVAFDALTYKNNEVGIHKYTVEEVKGTETGIEYDPMKAEVTVTVTKAGHTLTATKALPTDTEFNNTFTPAATSAQFKFTKKLEGKALEADAFTFELLENGQVLQTKKNAADGTIQFDAISYDKEGTHTYTVREVAGTDTDIDYDTMNAEVTVKVTKDATTGILTANVVMPEDSEFNNYAVAPVTAQFDFSKVLAGRTLKAGEFSFVLKDATGKVLQTKTNDASGKVAFDALTYKNNEVGIHKYTVEEVKGTETGIEYDPMKAEVTVTVTKAGHTLTATKALPTDTEFNNTFTPAATSAQFKFTKKLEGKALEADAFTFELLENGQVLQTKKNAADGTIQFDAISYDKEGTHTYTVREVAGTDTDIDYDTMNAEVTVKVTKDATTGILTANVVMPEDSEFNNYAVAPVTAQFDFSKVLAGRTLKAGEFSFVLKDATGKVLQTKTNDASGKVAFDALTYKNNEVGIHKYTVEEVKGTETGIEYDPMKAEVTVTVTKAGHTLTATKALPTDTEFNNTFTPAATSAQFKFTKKLEGKALEADAFTFELLENGQVLQTKKNAADGTIQFDAISYDKEGSHTYTVREVAGTDTDIDYDTMNAEVTVKVTKDATTGILTANVVMPEDSEFNNYAVAPVTAQFDFSKVLAGRTLKAGEFSFVLKDATGKVLQTKTNDASGKVAFDALTYKNNEVGIHKYTVEEVKGTETGIEYDPMKAEVTVTVTKAGHTLTATKALPTDTEFNNTFTPAATSAQFKFTKKLEGKALEADAFTFELLENGQVLQTKKNAADGTIQFDAISYDKEGTHTYTVREVAGTDTDIDYDTMNAEVTVKVTKDATTGILTANVVMPEDSEFNNYAVAPVTAQFDFSKVLAGRTLKAGEFSFVLKDATGKVLQTKTNDASGKVAFDALTYKNNEVGIHKYTVEEVKGTETGIEYDPMKAEVTVTVTKAGHTLTATKALPTDTEFNNTFTPAATSAQFKFTKKLEGKALEADAFTFELLENGQVLQTKKNAADGTIQFDAISYDKEGSHTYTVREVAGSDTNIDYDDMNAVVTVNVTKDAASGILTANVTMPADSEFNNYAVAPVTVQFNFTKKLEGRELKAGEFSFVLKDEKGNIIETVANDASGKIKFSALTFKHGEEGTYIYHVEEVKGTETGIEYDHMIATVGVKVKKDGRVLTAITELPADTEFNNKVTPPTPPTPVVPPVTPPTPPTPVVPPVTPPTPPTPIVPPVTPPIPPTPEVQTVKSVTSLIPVVYEDVKEQELPKTGDNKSEVAIEVGGLLTLVGLVLSRKRKNNS